MLASVVISLILALVIRYCVPLICIGFAASLSRDFTFGDYFNRMKGNGYVNSIFERIVLYGMILCTVVMCWFIKVFWFQGLMIDISCILVLTAKCVVQKQTALAFCWCYSKKNSGNAGTRTMYGNNRSMYSNGSMYGGINSRYGSSVMYGVNYNQQYANQYGRRFGQQYSNPLAYRNLPIDPVTGLPIENPSPLSDGYKRFKDIKKKISDKIDELNTPEEEKENKEEIIKKTAGETAVFNEAGVERPLDKVGEYDKDDAEKINISFKSLVPKNPSKYKVNGRDAVKVAETSGAYIFSDNGDIIFSDSVNNDHIVKPRQFSSELHVAVFDDKQITEINTLINPKINTAGYVSNIIGRSMTVFHCVDTISGSYMPNAFPEVLGFSPVGVYTIGDETYTVFKSLQQSSFIVGWDYGYGYVIDQLYLINGKSEQFRVLRLTDYVPDKIAVMTDHAHPDSHGECIKFTIDGKPIMRQEAIDMYGYDPVSKSIDLGISPEEVQAETQALYIEPDEEKRKNIRNDIVAEKRGEAKPVARVPRRITEGEKQVRNKQTFEDIKKVQNANSSGDVQQQTERTTAQNKVNESKNINTPSKTQVAYAFCSYSDEFRKTCGTSISELNAIKKNLSANSNFKVDDAVNAADKLLKSKYDSWCSRNVSERQTSDKSAIDELLSSTSADVQETSVQRDTKQDNTNVVSRKTDIEALLESETGKEIDESQKREVKSDHNLSEISKQKTGVEDLLASQTGFIQPVGNTTENN